jgi:hypothetical protein
MEAMLTTIKTLYANTTLNIIIFLLKGIILSSFVSWCITPLSFSAALMVLLIHDILHIKIIHNLTFNNEENGFNINLKFN